VTAPVRAAVVAIGDEIVGGLTVDTNSGFVAQALRAVGVAVVSGFSTSDDEAAILATLERALADAELVVTTGGLGPTADDLTTACVARLAGRGLRLHEESLRRIEARFRERGLGEMPANNRKQALIPEGSELVPNPTGTAPGFVCPVERGGAVRHVVSLPGVPREMRRMVEETLVPWVRERRPDRSYASRVFSIFGLTESKLDELLAGVVEPGEARLAFRAAFPLLQARATVEGAPGDDLEGRLEAIEARVRERLGAHLYAIGDEPMEAAMGRLLAERSLTLAVAESCTGGLIGHRITEVPGSSAYFLLGIVSYSNEAKERLLGVPPATLREHGAVSTGTAEAMAAGVRRQSGADLGLATTGVAGPGGGTPEKPVGTVCVGLAWEGGAWSRRYDLGARDREWIKQMTAQIALDRVRRWALETSSEP
jgi:nicotinamide-nucleotide amidase